MRIAGWPGYALMAKILGVASAPQDPGRDTRDDGVVRERALHDGAGPDEDAGAEPRPGKQDRAEPDVGAVADHDARELERAVHDRRAGRRLRMARGEDQRARC